MGREELEPLWREEFFPAQGRKWKAMSGDTGKSVDQEAGNPLNTDHTFTLQSPPRRPQRGVKHLHCAILS